MFYLLCLQHKLDQCCQITVQISDFRHFRSASFYESDVCEYVLIEPIALKLPPINMR